MNLANPLPSVDTLNAMFTFDPETGSLLWKERIDARGHRTSRYVGKPAGTKYPGGYLRITIGKLSFGAHRIVWAMHHSTPPEDMEIDHIDHNPANNRIENLRLTTKAQNQWNQRVRTGSSQFKGVIWNKRDRRWQAQIKYAGVHQSLGYFTDETQAARAYDRAARALMGEFAHVNGA